MKFLLLSLLLCSFASARTLEELKSECIKALETRDHELLWSLSHYEDQPEIDLNQQKAAAKKHFDAMTDYGSKNNLGDYKVISIEDTDIDELFPQPFNVSLGRRVDFVSKPLGVWKIWGSFKEAETVKNGYMKVYGVVNGSYCFLSKKLSPLNWNGPKDRRISINTVLKLSTPSNALLEITWNASGITLTQKIRISTDGGGGNGISGFYGQYIERISILEAEPYESIEIKIAYNKETGEEDVVIFQGSFKEGKKVLYQRP